MERSPPIYNYKSDVTFLFYLLFSFVLDGHLPYISENRMRTIHLTFHDLSIVKCKCSLLLLMISTHLSSAEVVGDRSISTVGHLYTSRWKAVIVAHSSRSVTDNKFCSYLERNQVTPCGKKLS